METLDLPKPQIKTRPVNSILEQLGLEAGLHPVIARVIASRPLAATSSIVEALSPKLSQLSLPSNMRDMQQAAGRIVQAILQGECIGIETDHDCDGQTSSAILYYNLVHRFHHPAAKIRSYIGHRLTEGYGLSDAVATRILNDDPRPSLVITADNGSSDEPRIVRLKAAGIDVIVTDHHEIPVEGWPRSAYACLNPTRPDCDYGDPYIAGCMVAWLLMASVRQQLIEQQYLLASEPSLSDSLDFVAVGTVADCVSMARSANNRAVVAYGLKLIEAGTRPCWRAFKAVYPGALRSEDLGFRLGPLLNSDGRLSSAFGSVNFLLAETEEEAQIGLAGLQTHNENRKTIQRQLVQQAIVLAQKQLENQTFSLSLYLPEGHSGVQGIAASRIKDLLGRPTAIFAPKTGTQDLITGSVRGIEPFHVREALQYVAQKEPNLLLAFGGHKGAGGLTLALQYFPSFTALFEEACQAQLAPHSPLQPVVWTDGNLSRQELSLDFLRELAVLEPHGREFEPPVFELQGQLVEIRGVGDGTHARVQLKMEGSILSGIWFSARPSTSVSFNVQAGALVRVVCSLKENSFRGKQSLDIQVLTICEG